MRVTLSILLLLSVALGAPTVHGATASAAASDGCGCDSVAACAMGCCTSEAIPADDDVEELCDCNVTDAVPAAPAVPTASGSEKPIRDAAHDPAPRIADTNDAATIALATEGPAPPRQTAPVPSALCVWRN